MRHKNLSYRKTKKVLRLPKTNSHTAQFHPAGAMCSSSEQLP
jgi:hypothetical protein